MSSVTIVVLVLAGIIALMFIGYLNNLLEKNKIDKARRKAELIDRQRRCSTLSESLPGQLLTPDLKQLLNTIEQHIVKELVQIDNNPAYKVRAEELQQLIAAGQNVPINNPVIVISSDEQIKDIRFQLESLQAQIIRAVEEKILPSAQGKQWLGQVRTMLVTLYVDYFSTLGNQLLGQGQAGRARIVFERGVQFLKKQKDVAAYKQQLAEFQASLAQATALVVEQTGPNAQKNGELTSAVEQENQPEEWKKKQIYD